MLKGTTSRDTSVLKGATYCDTSVLEGATFCDILVLKECDIFILKVCDICLLKGAIFLADVFIPTGRHLIHLTGVTLVYLRVRFC